MLADRLGFDYLDTGMMYRAVTYIAHRRGVEIDDVDGLGRIAVEVVFEVQRRTVDDGGGGSWRLLVDGEDLTDRLHSEQINGSVSIVSAVAAVREALVRQQREMAERGAIVMVGRDIGTVVLADAPLKIFLTASTATRAARRTQDADGNLDAREYDEVLRSLERRDEIDSNRAISPLRPARDAITIATDDLTIEEVVDKIEALVRELKNHPSQQLSNRDERRET